MELSVICNKVPQKQSGVTLEYVEATSRIHKSYLYNPTLLGEVLVYYLMGMSSPRRGEYNYSSSNYSISDWRQELV